MIKIPLNNNKFTIVDDIDAHLLKWKWFYQPRRNKDGCAYRSVYVNENGHQFNRTVRLHHCIVGFPLNGCVDHINGDPLDNRRNNLRFVSIRDNSWNRVEHRGQKHKSSRFPNVSYDKSRSLWESYIMVYRKRIHLGRYADEIKAYNAVLDFKSKI